MFTKVDLFPRSDMDKASPYDDQDDSTSGSPQRINTQPFAGRLAGNQAFTLSPSSPSTQSTPVDSTRNPSWSSLLSPSGFRSPLLWRLAFFEGVGTCLQVFLSGLLSVGLIPTVTETPIGPVLTVTYAALTQFFILTLFVYAGGPVSGAHFNPLISIATFITKLSSLPRTALYVVFQCIGAVVGAFLVRGAIGASPAELKIVPGCYIDPSIVTPGQAFLFETVTSFVGLFLAFGLGLDPRNTTTFGPALAPVLVGFAGAVTLFAGGIARKGYLGASNNPARCLGLMAAAERFDYHWVHWVGDVAAAMINAGLYFTVAPYKR